MSKNKIAKIITILILIFILLGTVYVYAVGDPFTNPGDWAPGNLEEDRKFTDKVANVLGVIQVIGIIVAAIVLVIAGIKFMFGSIEEKAEYKKAMIPYLIGSVLLVAATTIPKIAYEITNGLF